jgi:hypothetical protein
MQSVLDVLDDVALPVVVTVPFLMVRLFQNLKQLLLLT